MIEVRKFNDDGMKEFYDFIIETRKKEDAKAPQLIFPDFHKRKDLTTSFSSKSSKIDEKKIFNDRYELGLYLNKICPEFKNEHDNLGLWAWLAAVYFSQLRQRGRHGTQRSEHFIPDEYSQKTLKASNAFRHSVRMAFFLVLKQSDSFCKFIMTGRPTHEMGDAWGQCCSRKSLLTSPSMIALILKLYQDPKTGFCKKGVFSSPGKTRKSIAGKGGCRRLLTILLPRLKKSFDIEVMNPDQLIDVAGRELASSKWVKADP